MITLCVACDLHNREERIIKHWICKVADHADTASVAVLFTSIENSCSSVNGLAPITLEHALEMRRVATCPWTFG